MDTFHDPGSILNSALVTPRCTAATCSISQRVTLSRSMRYHPETDSPISGNDFSRTDETSQSSLDRVLGAWLHTRAMQAGGRLYRQLKKLPWAAVPAISDLSTDHGRRA